MITHSILNSGYRSLFVYYIFFSLSSRQLVDNIQMPGSHVVVTSEELWRRENKEVRNCLTLRSLSRIHCQSGGSKSSHADALAIRAPVLTSYIWAWSPSVSSHITRTIYTALLYICRELNCTHLLAPLSPIYTQVLLQLTNPTSLFDDNGQWDTRDECVSRLTCSPFIFFPSSSPVCGFLFDFLAFPFFMRLEMSLVSVGVRAAVNGRRHLSTPPAPLSS